VTGTYRGVVAAFDAIAMVAVAFTLTKGSLADRDANVVIWGSAGAAIVAALVVLTNGPAVLAWAAVGYVLFAALLATARPVPLLLLLAVAYMPIIDRPRGSLVTGLAISAVTALVLRAVLPLLA
jgi:hypothetical protein